MRIVISILKIIGAIFFGLAALGGIISLFSIDADGPKVTSIIFICIFLALAIFFVYSVRKGNNKNKKADPSLKKCSRTVKISTYTPDAPEDVLQEMRKYYTATQAQNDVRIMAESFKIAQKTTDFETFFSRLELAQRSALTLLQAVKAGCKGINPKQTISGCEAVLSNVRNCKIVFLDNSYLKETNAALSLKTASGQRNRLNKYLNKLKEYETQFMDVEDTYTSVVTKTQELIP